MGFKKIAPAPTFADSLFKISMEKNRCLARLINIEDSIDWSRINEILIGHYPVGFSKQGTDAYPPLMLFKCLLLQKWFHINSDPELESQINDRISFKKFIAISFSAPSPDHSTFSRFRNRLSKKVMDQIHPVKYDLSLFHDLQIVASDPE